jgi:hypothetical protein
MMPISNTKIIASTHASPVNNQPHLNTKIPAKYYAATANQCRHIQPGKIIHLVKIIIFYGIFQSEE